MKGYVHPSVDIPGIADGIDVEVVELVKLLNKMEGVYTTSSCQGSPGPIDGEQGFYGHVTVRLRSGSWLELSRFLFYDFLIRIDKKTLEDVDVSVHWNGETTETRRGGFVGWIYFRNEALKSLTEQVRKWQVI